MLKVLLSCVFLFFTVPGQSVAAEPPLVIRFSTQAPPDGQQFQSMLHFKERVEAESQGKIRVDLYDTGKLYEDNKVAAAVSSGEVEIGHVNLSRYAETIVIADAFYLPFMFTDAPIERASRTSESEIRKLIDDAILKTAGARVLWWIPEGSIVFLANGSSMANPSALAGKRVRSSGPTIAETIRLCGGQPKDIPATLQQKAYSTGEVDVGMTSITAVMARKLFQSMNTITRTGHAISNFVVVVNEKFWQSLSSGQRAILNAAAIIADKEAADRLAEFEEAAYRQLTEKEGVKVVTLSKEELQLWRICSSDVLSGFVEKARDPGESLIKAYAKLRQDACCNLAEAQTAGLNK